MKYIFLAPLIFLAACGDEKKLPEARNGYDYYIKVCVYEGDAEDSCKCRADILKKYLTDQKIMQFAKATMLVSEGKKEESDEIIEKNPELVTALAKIADESKACDSKLLEDAAPPE